MSQVEVRDWKKRRKTAVCVVDGEQVTFRKRGTGRLLDDVAQHPVFGDAIEALAEMNMAGGAKPGQVDALKGAVSKAAEANGISSGKAVRELVTKLPRVIIDVLVEDTVLPEGEDRDDYREWVESLGPSDLIDMITGWVALNLPEFKGPFVKGAAVLLARGKQWIANLAPANDPAAPIAPAAAEPKAKAA